jgi:hypothetical protein
VGTGTVWVRDGILVVVGVADTDGGVWVTCKGVGVITTGVVDSWIPDELGVELLVGIRVEEGL